MKTRYNHPVLGEITINRSARSRRVSVSVRPSGVTLTLPVRFPLEEALAFAESKAEWIGKAKQRAEKRITPPRVIRPPFRTRNHELALGRGDKAAAAIGQREIRVTLPEDWAIEGAPAQAFLRKVVTETFRREAREWLPERVAGLAAQFGFRYTGISFRNTVSRWGSCSGKNSLSLSINLMILPDALIDYVILHELCHTVQKNHGPKFHALLDRVTGGRHRELDRQLKQYTPRW